MSQEDFCGSAPELEPKWNLQAEVLTNLCGEGQSASGCPGDDKATRHTSGFLARLLVLLEAPVHEPKALVFKAGKEPYPAILARDVQLMEIMFPGRSISAMQASLTTTMVVSNDNCGDDSSLTLLLFLLLLLMMLLLL